MEEKKFSQEDLARRGWRKEVEDNGLELWIQAGEALLYEPQRSIIHGVWYL